MSNEATAYRYYCPFRPPMLGAIPKEGLIEVHTFEERTQVPDCYRPVWGWADYDRVLTAKELSDFELIPRKNKTGLFCAASTVVEKAREDLDGMWPLSPTREQDFERNGQRIFDAIEQTMLGNGYGDPSNICVEENDYCSTLVISVEYLVDHFRTTGEREMQYLLRQGVIIDVRPFDDDMARISFSLPAIWADQTEE